MIPQQKNRVFNVLFARHVRARIRRNFEALRVRGLGKTLVLSFESPLLIVSNHTSWWDPLLAIYLSTFALRTDGFAMMNADNLKRFPFFTRVGAFGVEINNARDGLRGIRYAAKLLNDRKRLVWIYAQGEERPVTERPLGFRRGAAAVERLARTCRVVPVAIRYEFGREEKPTAYVSFGDPLPRERDLTQASSAHERAVGAELERIDRALCANESQKFVAIVTGKTRVWAALGVWLLSIFAVQKPRFPKDESH